jgi:hypothetical protein
MNMIFSWAKRLSAFPQTTGHDGLDDSLDLWRQVGASGLRSKSKMRSG